MPFRSRSGFRQLTGQAKSDNDQRVHSGETNSTGLTCYMSSRAKMQFLHFVHFASLFNYSSATLMLHIYARKCEEMLKLVEIPKMLPTFRRCFSSMQFYYSKYFMHKNFEINLNLKPYGFIEIICQWSFLNFALQKELFAFIFLLLNCLRITECFLQRTKNSKKKKTAFRISPIASKHECKTQ